MALHIYHPSIHPKNHPHQNLNGSLQPFDLNQALELCWYRVHNALLVRSSPCDYF